MAITAPPQPPLPTDDEITFNTKAGPWLDWQYASVAEFNALQTDVTVKQGIASDAATTATTKAGEASASALAASNSESAAGLSAAAAADSEGAASLSESAAAASALAAAGSEGSAAASAQQCADLVAGIAGGPVASVNGKTGIVALTAADVGAATGADITAERSAAATLTNKTLLGAVLHDGYTEEIFAVTGTTPVLSPTNGSIQTWTLSGASTPTAGTWGNGQSLTLMIDDGSANTINWSSLSVTWKTNGGSAPTLQTTGFTVIQLWKVGGTIYGTRVGDA